MDPEDDFIADDFEPDPVEAAEPPAEASLPGYETRTARALVLPQVDVIGDPSAPAEGPSLGSATMREGPGEVRDIEVAHKAPAVRVDANSPERSRVEILRDMVRATMGDRGSLERTSQPRREGGESPLLTRASRDFTDAVAGSSEGTTGEYQGDRAGISGLVDGATLGFADEARGLVRGGLEGYEEERDAARDEMRTAREQNPDLYGGGELAGALASGLAVPGGTAARGATATARIGQAARTGAALGGVAGYGHSEAEGADALLDVGTGAAGGALMGTVAGAGAEAVRGVPQGIARWLERRGELAAEVAPRARLEASGVWGGRAMQAADELPGGQEALAGDLRRLQIGERGPGRASFDPAAPPRGRSVPRPDRAAGDAERVRQAAGQQLGQLAQEADEAGAAVPTSRIVEGAERAARQLEELGSDTANRAAQRIRREVQPLAGRPDMPFTAAWRLRQFYDSLADFSGTPGADDALSAAGGSFRDLRQTVAREMDAAMTSAAPQARQAWQQASRDYQVTAFLRDSGRGAERLSTVGGIGGAVANGMQMVAGGVNPLAMAAQVPGALMQRMGAQESRMLAPGVATRVHESVAERAPQIARWLTDTLQAGGEALGPYAAHFRAAMQRAAPMEAVSTVHYLLSQRDPEYRAHIERARQEQADGSQ